MISAGYAMEALNKSHKEICDAATALGISFTHAELAKNTFMSLMSEEDFNKIKEHFESAFPVLDRDYLTSLLDDEEPMKCFTVEHGMTICTLTTKSGFVVTGSSAPLNIADYSQELGDKYAADEAFNKLAELQAYHLKMKKFEA